MFLILIFFHILVQKLHLAELINAYNVVTKKKLFSLALLVYISKTLEQNSYRKENGNLHYLENETADGENLNMFEISNGAVNKDIFFRIFAFKAKV